MSGTPVLDGSSRGAVIASGQGNTASINNHYHQCAANEQDRRCETQELSPLMFGTYQAPHRNHEYVHRLNLEKKIQDRFSNTKAYVVLTAYGFGGVGKTQLAQNYFHSKGVEIYPFRIWLHADSDSILKQNFLGLIDKFQLQKKEESLTEEKKLDRIISHLDTLDHCLIVFDNAQGSYQIDPYLPAMGSHHILVTSRNFHWDAGSKIPVDIMDYEEAVEFFKLKIGEKNSIINFEENKAMESLLSNRLGCLPLAIAQAGAYIHEHKDSKAPISDYLLKYDQEKVRLLGREGEDNVANHSFLKTAEGLSFGAKHEPVWITFNLNFKSVKDRSFIAHDLLEFIAFCYTDLIPKEFFRQIVSNLSKDHNTPAEYDDIIKIITDYSLILTSEPLSTFRMHVLIKESLLIKILEEKSGNSLIIFLTRVVNEFERYLNSPESLDDKIIRAREFVIHVNALVSTINSKGFEEKLGPDEFEKAKRISSNIFSKIIGLIYSNYRNVAFERTDFLAHYSRIMAEMSSGIFGHIVVPVILNTIKSLSEQQKMIVSKKPSGSLFESTMSYLLSDLKTKSDMLKVLGATFEAVTKDPEKYSSLERALVTLSFGRLLNDDDQHERCLALIKKAKNILIIQHDFSPNSEVILSAYINEAFCLFGVSKYGKNLPLEKHIALLSESKKIIENVITIWENDDIPDDDPLYVEAKLELACTEKRLSYFISLSNSESESSIDPLYLTQHAKNLFDSSYPMMVMRFGEEFSYTRKYKIRYLQATQFAASDSSSSDLAYDDQFITVTNAGEISNLFLIDVFYWIKLKIKSSLNRKKTAESTARAINLFDLESKELIVNFRDSVHQGENYEL